MNTVVCFATSANSQQQNWIDLLRQGNRIGACFAVTVDCFRVASPASNLALSAETDVRHKLAREGVDTDAAVHDTSHFEDLLDDSNTSLEFVPKWPSSIGCVTWLKQETTVSRGSPQRNHPSRWGEIRTHPGRSSLLAQCMLRQFRAVRASPNSDETIRMRRPRRSRTQGSVGGEA